jgi:hypothetical protein
LTELISVHSSLLALPPACLFLSYTKVFLFFQQRYLVITKSPLLGGLAAMHDSEVDYTIGAILANPLGMKAHGDKYLKGLYKGDNNLLVVDDRISGVCLKVLCNDWGCVFELATCCITDSWIHDHVLREIWPDPLGVPLRWSV